MSAMQLRALTAARTHEGHVRQINEDSFISADDNGLWAVADGMGGHENGEWASARVVEELRRGPLPQDFDDACREIGERIHLANAAIYDSAAEKGVQMGTTVVVLYVQGHRFSVLWVGDSRAYLLRDGRLHQLSRDHTQVQDMVERGLLSPEEAEEHPMGHVLSRAVGVTPEVEVDVIQDEIEPGDTFLLCSDGLHGCVEEGRILSILSGASPDTIAELLINASFESGAPDNVTVVATRFVEPTFLLFSEPVVTA